MHDKNLKIEKKELFAVSSKSNDAIAVESKGGEALHTDEIERPPREDADNSLWYMFC